MERCFITLSILLFLSLLGCSSSKPPETSGQPLSGAQTAAIEQRPTFATDKGKILTVDVAEENVRQFPNGRKLGKLYQGDKLVVVKRVGNWVLFNNDRFSEAYIWAPSVGFPYQNLYSSAFFFDPEKKRFYDVEYFQRAFSQRGQRRLDLQSYYELFFKDIGLGSHEFVVMDGGAALKQVVDHGITLYIDKKSEQVRKVRVDYYRPIKGYEKALEKSELPVKAPAEEGRAHFIWQKGDLLEKLTVDLERQEWDSQWFSSIWFIMED